MSYTTPTCYMFDENFNKKKHHFVDEVSFKYHFMDEVNFKYHFVDKISFSIIL